MSFGEEEGISVADMDALAAVDDFETDGGLPFTVGPDTSGPSIALPAIQIEPPEDQAEPEMMEDAPPAAPPTNPKPVRKSRKRAKAKAKADPKPVVEDPKGRHRKPVEPHGAMMRTGWHCEACMWDYKVLYDLERGGKGVNHTMPSPVQVIAAHVKEHGDAPDSPLPDAKRWIGTGHYIQLGSEVRIARHAERIAARAERKAAKKAA